MSSLNAMVYKDLYNKIKTGYYKEGDLLPTEVEMESIYGISRAPIRQALGKLVNEGLVKRQAGKGTFVSFINNLAYSEMNGFGQEFLEKGNKLECKTLLIKSKKLPADIAGKLDIDVVKAAYLERVRLYKSQPIQFLRHYVFCLSPDKLKQEGDFHSLLEVYDKHSIDITGAKEVIEAIGADAAVAEALCVEQGTPLLHIERTTYYDQERIAEYLDFYILTAKWKYRMSYGQIE